MRLSIIIPNYNGEELLRKNLPDVIDALSSFLKNHNEKGEIIIVDDASEDHSVAFIQEVQIVLRKSSLITLKSLVNNKNHGFSSTVNKGVSAADGEIIVLLNTDVSPEKDFLSALVKHFSNEQIFAVGCMDKSIENGDIVFRGRGVGSWQKGLLVHKKGDINKMNTLWASGGSSAFNKKLWESLGGLYDIYNPFYWEDIDLSYRAQKAGYIVLFEKESIVTHKHESGVIKTRYSHADILTIAYRNQFLFVWINVSDINILLEHLAWLPYHILSAFLRGDVLLLKGFFKAFFLLPQALSYRGKTQQFHIKKDSEIVVS